MAKFLLNLRSVRQLQMHANDQSIQSAKIHIKLYYTIPNVQYTSIRHYIAPNIVEIVNT